MKILFVSPVPTDPTDAGNRARILTLVTSLQSAGHEVHFAYIPMEPVDTDAMQRRLGISRFHLLPWKPTPLMDDLWPRYTRKLGRFFNRENAFLWALDDWYDDRTSEALAKLQATHHFDAVFVEYVFMSKAFEAFPKECLRLLDTHDCFGMRHRKFLDAGMRPQWFSTTLEEEETGFRRADAVLAIQPLEAEGFRKRLGPGPTRVLQVGHLIELGDPPPPSSRDAAVFMGSSNPINVAGANHFITQVMPLVRQARPSFEFILGGAVANEVPDAQGVVKLGFVPHVRDAFGSAMVAVNPVLMGTGVNIKLLDALACAMPCVSTESGARGLDQYRKDSFVAVPDDRPQAFADEVLKLLSDGRARARLGAAARRAAEHWNGTQLDVLTGLLLGTGRADRPVELLQPA
jgi:glycosyltransferase involved in cell wall biosynthesis